MNADDFLRTKAGRTFARQAEAGEFGFTVSANCGNGWLLPPYVAPGGNGWCDRPTWAVTTIAPGGGSVADIPADVVASAARELHETLGIQG